MSVSVTMPRLGESVTEGTVTRWLKKEGDQVAVDEPLLEVSTDKVDTEIPSPVAGVLSKITVAEDETVEVGSELAVIDDGSAGGAPASAPATGEADATPAAEPEAAPAVEQTSEPDAEQPHAEQPDAGQPDAGQPASQPEASYQPAHAEPQTPPAPAARRSSRGRSIARASSRSTGPRSAGGC